MVELATIYQGKHHVRKYTRKLPCLLSRALLHFELTGEILPYVKDIVDIFRLKNPQASSKPSLQTAADQVYKATCVDQAIDKTHAEKMP